jgi:hypothetical protein
MPGPEVLTLGDLPEATGLTYGTILNYSSRGLLPPADIITNQEMNRPTRLWLASTIDEWNRERGRR